MRHQQDARVISVKKADLIKRVLENKEKHVKEYQEAVEAIKIEAQDQLEANRKYAEAGEYHKMRFQLTTPINNAKEYDKIVEMFNWEIKDEVELSQGEFNEYVLDETHFAIAARSSNTMYAEKLSNLRGGGR
jgi:hypothetical protein